MTETITLADGTVINTTTGKPVRNNGVPAGFTALPTNSQALRDVTRVKKRLADLPDIPEKMNIIGAVASYYLFGLDEYETALALGVTQQQVERIKMTEAFTKMIDSMTDAITERTQDDVRGLIMQQSHSAVHRLVAALDSDNEQAAIVAAKDLLDRAGHRPADVVEHRHTVEGGLAIEYITKGRDEQLPTLDVTPVENDDDDCS